MSILQQKKIKANKQNIIRKIFFQVVGYIKIFIKTK